MQLLIRHFKLLLEMTVDVGIEKEFFRQLPSVLLQFYLFIGSCEDFNLLFQLFPTGLAFPQIIFLVLQGRFQPAYFLFIVMDAFPLHCHGCIVYSYDKILVAAAPTVANGPSNFSSDYENTI